MHRKTVIDFKALGERYIFTPADQRVKNERFSRSDGPAGTSGKLPRARLL